MKILAMVWKHLVISYKDPMNLFLTIALPIILIFIIGYGFSGTGTTSKVLIADSDNSPTSRALIDYLSSDSNFSFEIKPPHQIEEEIKNGKALSGINIKAGFSNSIMDDKPAIELIAQSKSPEVYLLVNRISSFLRNERLKNSFHISQYAEIAPVFNVYEERLDKEADNSTLTNFEIIIIVAMFSTTYSAGEVLLEKRRGTWGRLMSSPIKKYEIISGYLTGIILEGFIQIGLLISLSIILFKTSWGNSFLGLAIVVLALMFAMTGIGLMLTGSVKTYGQLQAIGPLVIFPTSMLSGIFWPVEIMPSYLQNIAAIMPQYWAIDGMKKLLLSNFSFNMLIKPVSILVIIGLITMGAGMRALK